MELTLHEDSGQQAQRVMLDRLFHVFSALEQVEEKVITHLAADAPATPDSLDARFTPNQALLQAAVAYVDANLLPIPPSNTGIDKAQAQALAAEVFTLQLQLGHGVIPVAGDTGTAKACETLTSSHAQLWHAGAAALLVAALRVSDFQTWDLAVKWWRAEAALCHLTAWANTWDFSQGSGKQGHYQVIAPGARGGSVGESQPLPENPARDLDYEILLTGALPFERSATRDSFYLAPWLLSGLPEPALDFLRKPGSGAPLTGPNGIQGPWTVNDVPLLPEILSVLRAGNQHAAWFQQLTALEPQLQAGVNANGAWYSFWDSCNPSIPNGVPDSNYTTSPFDPPVIAIPQQFGSAPS